MITVVVPVYNVGEKLIDRCVSSILAQTYADYEVILVDDGSTDDSGAVCDKWGQRDFRIKVIHQENKGLSGARNTGIKNGTGDYYSFVDSDDWIHPDMLKELMTSVRKYKSQLAICGVSITNGDTFFDKNGIEKECVFNRTDAIKLLAEDEVITSHAWNKLYSKSIVSEDMFPEGFVYEDIRMMHEVFDKCDLISVCPKCLYYYFQREDSITGEKRIKTLVNNVESLKVRKDYFKENYPELEDIIKVKIIETITIFLVKNRLDKEDYELNTSTVTRYLKGLKSRKSKHLMKAYSKKSIKAYYFLIRVFGLKANWIYRHFIMKKTSSYKMWKEKN